MSSSVTLVIRTFGPEEIYSIINKIKSQTSHQFVCTELIIVNGDPLRPLSEVLAREWSGGMVELFIPQDFFSYGRSLNIGVERATNEIVLLLSGHSVPVDENWLESMLIPFADHRVAAVCGAQIPRRTSNGLERAYRTIWYSIPVVARIIGVFNATNASIRKSVWMGHQFDEKLMSCEDREWACRVKHNGWNVEFSRSGAVIHSHDIGYIASIEYFRVLTTNTILAWIACIRNGFSNK